MTAATATIIDLSAYRHRRDAKATPVAIPRPTPVPVAWVPAVVFVPVVFVALG